MSTAPQGFVQWMVLVTLESPMDLGLLVLGHQAYGAGVSLAQTASCFYLYTNCVRPVVLCRERRREANRRGLTNTRGKHACGGTRREY